MSKKGIKCKRKYNCLEHARLILALSELAVEHRRRIDELEGRLLTAEHEIEALFSVCQKLAVPDDEDTSP